MFKLPFKRLWSDERGNTLALAAAVTIPLLGLVGSGVDLSRTYLAKNRLQQACDAGVIAGRKVLTTTVDSTVTAEVRKFVNFNFPQGYLETAAFSIDPTDGAEKSVMLTLATSVPTGIMKIFGITSMDISVDCTGRQDFINTDVMLVLDTTLSMNCLPSDGNIVCATEKTGSKIDALRGGVVEFYRSLRDAQTKLETAGLRLRYGIVPYSMSVNVGKLLYAKNTTWIRNPANYQYCASSGCSSPTFPSVNHSTTWLTSASWGGCIEERQTVTTINASSGYNAPAGAYDLDIDSAPTNDATRWAPYDPASATAKTSPTHAALLDACPKEARPLAAFATEADLTNWLQASNGFTADGYTYLDLGLIWGARMFSETGLWASDNPLAFNGFPVNRHLILMTDGQIDPDLNVYTSYGVEKFSTGGRRVSGNGSSSNQDASHTQRFRMMCNKLKGMDISVWVIAFGSTSSLTTELKNCASAPTQAFHAANQAALNAHFKQIGESIGALRLSE